MTLSPLLIENMVRMALTEDLGHGHDVPRRFSSRQRQPQGQSFVPEKMAFLRG